MNANICRVGCRVRELGAKEWPEVLAGYLPFPSLFSFLPFPAPPSYPSPPVTLYPAMVAGRSWRFSLQIQAEPGRQTHFSAF